MTPRTKSATAREQLSREVLVQAALAVADAEGLEAVSIRRLAGDLGVTPMALYWHVAGKDELLAAIGDSLYDELHLDLDPTDPWPTRLRAIVAALLDLIHAHPGAIPLVARRILHTDNGRALTETALGVLQEAGYDLATAMAIARQLLSSIIGLVAESDVAEQVGLSPQAWEQEKREKRAALLSLPPERFPLLVATAERHIDWTCDDDMITGAVDVLVAGIEALAPARA